MKFAKRVFLNLIPYLIFGFFILYFYSFYQTVYIEYYDEHVWIGRSYVVDSIAKLNFKSYLFDSVYAYDNQTLPELFYGILLYPDYLKAAKGKSQDYDYIKFLIDNNFFEGGEDKVIVEKYQSYIQENEEFINWQGSDDEATRLRSKFGQNFERTLQIIFKARRANIIVLSLSVVVLYLTLMKIYNRGIALFASFFYGTNWLVAYIGTLAQSEGLVLLLFNLSVYSLFLALSRGEKRYHFIFGIVTGLALQTKLNIGGAVLICYVTLIYLKEILKERRLIPHFSFFLDKIIVAAVALGVFILLNPYLYENTIFRLVNIFVHRWVGSNVELCQQLGNACLNSLGERASSVFGHLIYGSSGVNIFGSQIISDSFPRPIQNFIGIILLVLGFIRSLGFRGRKGRKQPLYFVLFFFAVTLITILYLKVNWERYYIYLVPIVVAVQTAGLGYIFGAGKGLSRRVDSNH